MAIEVRGLDRLFAKLDKLPGAVESAAVDGENKTLDSMTATAKELCPVDTGQLRDSLEPYAEAHKAKPNVSAVTGAIGTDVGHGIFVEFGTGPIGASTPVTGKDPEDVPHRMTGWTYYSEKGIVNDQGEVQHFIYTNGQPAQPFLYPAAQAHAKELPENIRQAGKKQLEALGK